MGLAIRSHSAVTMFGVCTFVTAATTGNESIAIQDFRFLG